MFLGSRLPFGGLFLHSRFNFALQCGNFIGCHRSVAVSIGPAQQAVAWELELVLADETVAIGIQTIDSARAITFRDYWCCEARDSIPARVAVSDGFLLPWAVSDGFLMLVRMNNRIHEWSNLQKGLTTTSIRMGIRISSADSLKSRKNMELSLSVASAMRRV